jgi:hypothetical protein
VQPGGSPGPGNRRLIAIAGQPRGRVVDDGPAALQPGPWLRNCTAAPAALLAVFDDLSMAEVAPAFERMCRELESPIPPLDAAIDIVIAVILREMADGEISPKMGCSA